MKKLQLTVKNISLETQLMRNNSWIRVEILKWWTITVNEDKAKIFVQSYPKKYKIEENTSEDNNTDLIKEISDLQLKVSLKDTENSRLKAKILNLEKEIKKVPEVSKVEKIEPIKIPEIKKVPEVSPSPKV